MTYTPTVWVDYGAPCIDAAHLNKMEHGIDIAQGDIMLLRGLAVAKPGSDPELVGRLYIETDKPWKVWRDNGAGWDQIGVAVDAIGNLRVDAGNISLGDWCAAGQEIRLFDATATNPFLYNYIGTEVRGGITFGTTDDALAIVERMRLSVEGFLAIGSTAVPTHTFEVHNPVGCQLIKSTTGTEGAYLQIENGSGYLVSGIENSVGGGLIIGTSAYAGVFGTSNNYPVQLATNGTPRLTISGDGRVGIGITAPAVSAQLEIAGTTGALLLSRLTTVQQAALTAVNGMVIYNTDNNRLEAYENGAWVDL